MESRFIMQLGDPIVHGWQGCGTCCERHAVASTTALRRLPRGEPLRELSDVAASGAFLAVPAKP